MICHRCGSDLRHAISDLPFKVASKTIVILKDLPVLECHNCGEYLLEDPVMARVEEILRTVDRGAELEIIPFAA